MDFNMILKCKKCSTPVTTQLNRKFDKLKDMIKTIQIMSDEEISQYEDGELTEYDTHRDIVLEDSYTKQSHAIRLVGSLKSKYSSYRFEVQKMYYYVSPATISEELRFNLDNKDHRGCCGLDSSPFICKCGEVLGDIDTDCWKLELLNIRVNKVYY